MVLYLALAGCEGGSGSVGPLSRTPDPVGGDPPSGPAGVGPLSRIPAPAGGDPPLPPCPAGTVDTRPSLNRCIARDEFLEKAREWSRDYRGESDFQNQWGLETIGADRAYAHLRLLKGVRAEPGEGVTIGFIDSGIDKNHPAFRDTAVTETFLPGAKDETGSESSHGTMVASVAAGDRVLFDPNSHHGVAWGADIAMFAIPLGSGGGAYEPISLAQLDNRDFYDSEEFKRVLGSQIDILNLSIGYTGNIEDYSESQLRRNYDRSIAVLAQKNTQEKTIIVWSASNDHGVICDPARVGATRCVKDGANHVVSASSPGLRAGMPARIAELRGHWIAVVAVKQDGSIADFSNRCGIAADYCIAAPGVEVQTADFGPIRQPGGVWQSGVRQWKIANGTSFSAPMVSGGLAIMKQLFRGQLSNTDLVTRLFTTADKTGIHADRSVYGQGLMDLGAATSPWGVASFRGTGRAVAEWGEPAGVAGSAIHPGSALGDSLGHALGGREIAAFDDLGAPFWFAAGDFVRPSPQDTASARLRRLFADPVDTQPEDDSRWPNVRIAGRESGHLTLAEGALRFNLPTPQDWSAVLLHRPRAGGNRPLSSFAAEWQPAGQPAVSLQAGWLAEQDSLLGASASGAFGRLSGHTAFVSAGLEADGPPGWLLTARGEMGIARPDPTGGTLIRDVSTLRTNAFRLAAERALSPRGATTVRFSVEQPLRVQRGTAILDLPRGRTLGGRVVGETIGVGLAPTGRQLDLRARIDHSLADGALSFESVWSRQPGHRADASAEWTVSVGWRRQF